MSGQNSLINDLESALSNKDLSKRAEILGQITDLFMLGSGKFTADQIDLFDDVMGKLVEQIELAARAAFGSRIAKCSDAPGGVIRLLAFDSAIQVAAPVLKHSARLDDDALAENARTMSQEHLLAISERSSISELITDVLIDRGDARVVTSTALNRGAKFSTSGFSGLAKRSQNDGVLALCVWSRPDIPRRELIRLFGQATGVVRRKLETADPRRAAKIRTAVAEASDEVQSIARVGSHEHASAADEIRLLHSRGLLNEAKLLEFVQRGDFDRTAVALSIMSDLPIGPIERAIAQEESEQILVIAKAIDLSWETVKAVLLLRLDHKVAKQDMNQVFASYFRLKTKTARDALQFFRLRQRSSVDASSSN